MASRRRVLVAYPIRYARQDENGRLTLDPAYASELQPAATPVEQAAGLRLN